MLKEIITALIIHLFIPLAGLIYFISLVRRMKKENISDPPTVELFIIFSTYGGLLLVVLTTLFWEWSGMASLGTFYLLIGAPIVMGIIAYRQRATFERSMYHKWSYHAALLYFAIAPFYLFLLSLRAKDWPFRGCFFPCF
jgi:hypothetical protein